jgi:pyruvate formate lyase activating enzyme
MGGEPTVAKELREMVQYSKCELGAFTKLGHTNGSNLEIPYLDAANIGFKAWNEDLHLQLTGRPKSMIFDQFSRAFDRGMELSASMIYIPGLIGLDELEGVVKYVASLDPEIYFHVMGYIPVTGLDYRRPTEEEMRQAVALCGSYLKKTGYSHLSSEQALDLTARDDRFEVTVEAGV